MAFGLYIVAALFIVSTIQQASSQDTKCTPGSRWKESCNNCWCSKDGQRKACTRRACPPGIENLPTESSRVERQAGCSPGVSWRQDCNTCRCTSTGIPICTRRACISNFPGGFRGRRSVDGEEEPACKPKTSWKSECNTCFCTDNGHAACTLMACAPSVPPRGKRQIQNQEPCNMTGSWMEDCNTCFCTRSGKACTLKFCVQGPPGRG